MSLIDLSKGFDFNDWTLIFTKLDSIGVRGVPLRWFSSYICMPYRMRIFLIKGQLSDPVEVRFFLKISLTLNNYGLLQASTLKSLLLLIYVRNLEKLLTIFFCSRTIQPYI